MFSTVNSSLVHEHLDIVFEFMLLLPLLYKLCRQIVVPQPHSEAPHIIMTFPALTDLAPHTAAEPHIMAALNCACLPGPVHRDIVFVCKPLLLLPLLHKLSRQIIPPQPHNELSLAIRYSLH